MTIYDLYKSKTDDKFVTLSSEQYGLEQTGLDELISVIDRLKTHEPSLESFYETLSQEAKVKKKEKAEVKKKLGFWKKLKLFMKKLSRKCSKRAPITGYVTQVRKMTLFCTRECLSTRCPRTRIRNRIS